MITHLYLTPPTVAEAAVAPPALPADLHTVAHALWPQTLVGMYLGLDMSWRDIVDALAKEGGHALSFSQVRDIVHEHYPRYATPDFIFALNGADITTMLREGISLTHIALEYGLPVKRMKVLVRHHLPGVVHGEDSRAVRSAIRLARAKGPVDIAELVNSIALWLARDDERASTLAPSEKKPTKFKGKGIGRIIIWDGDTEVFNVPIVLDDEYWRAARGPHFNQQILAMCARAGGDHYIVINSYLRRLYHREKTREAVTAVMAHEMGHVLAGHMARKNQRHPYFNDRPPEEWEELYRQNAVGEIADRVFYEEAAKAILSGAVRDIEYEADRYAAGLVGPSLIIATHMQTATNHPILGVRLEALNRVERHAREMLNPEYIPLGIWPLDFKYRIFTDEEIAEAEEEAKKAEAGKSEEHEAEDVIDETP